MGDGANGGFLRGTRSRIGRDIEGRSRTGRSQPRTGNETLTFLGCEQILVEEEIVMPDGQKRMVRGMTWDVGHAMKRCVAKYETAVKSQSRG